MILILEYYYQILLKISKDVLDNDNNGNISLSHEQNEIIKEIEKGIEDYLKFYFTHMKDNILTLNIIKKFFSFIKLMLL